jgi:hypothetical protein
MMFSWRNTQFDIFREKTGSSDFSGKKSGNPSKPWKKVLDQSEAAKHTKLCLNISKNHKLKPKNSF